MARGQIMAEIIRSKYGRIEIIDIIRGIDIIFMVMFNYSITLDYFYIIRIPSDHFYRDVLPISIASIFIFMSGVSARLSYEKDPERFGHRYFIRGLKLLFFAALVTLFTYIFVPGRTVYFGILHFFAAASFLVPIFIKYNYFNRAAGIFIVLLGILLQQTTFDFSYLSWLGLVPSGLSTFDYFPLIPWIGVILLGIYYSGNFIKRTASIRLRSDIFEFLGKHSLVIYLIHQPLLVLSLYVSGFKLF